MSVQIVRPGNPPAEKKYTGSCQCGAVLACAPNDLHALNPAWPDKANSIRCPFCAAAVLMSEE